MNVLVLQFLGFVIMNLSVKNLKSFRSQFGMFVCFTLQLTASLLFVFQRESGTDAVGDGTNNVSVDEAAKNLTAEDTAKNGVADNTTKNVEHTEQIVNKGKEAMNTENDTVTVMVLGAGRGPLLRATFNAADITDTKVKVIIKKKIL